MADPQNRRRAVLHAIIKDYVTNREPVGSKTLVERHNLGVSSATIRNDMMQLEEAGLIVQPHTSAGRIPTDAGYREFVDSLAEIKPLSRGEREAFRRVLTEAVDLDDVLARASKLLAQVTNQVAIVQYPSLRQTTLRHIEIVPASSHFLLLILITDAGRVEQRTLEISDGYLEEQVLQTRAVVNQFAAGRKHGELTSQLELALEALPFECHDLAQIVFTTIAQILQAETEERVVITGTGNLSRYDIDFSNTISPVLDALEEQVVLLKLFEHHRAAQVQSRKMHSQSSNAQLNSRTVPAQTRNVQVHIGHENINDAFAETSVISSGYGQDAEAPLGGIGVIGPTRMDYPGAISSVYAISQYLSEILGKNR
ncbi:MAG: heat-inducible transcriptional repressor HrcA [Arcanobacterium sp.]|nr:heat-inducible transcriptional repressor HrcA [Arcanobacterium sp.]